MTKIMFDNPVIIGTIQDQVTVKGMQLKNFSVNLAGPKGAPNVLVSLTLTDLDTGHDEHFVYEDETTTAAFVEQLQSLTVGNKGCIQILIERLQADGLLPAGTITN